MQTSEREGKVKVICADFTDAGGTPQENASRQGRTATGIDDLGTDPAKRDTLYRSYSLK